MTDAEREAQIRERVSTAHALETDANWEGAAVFLLRLLDEARAEIASRDMVISEMQQTFDLMWDADQRGIKAWQEANPGNDMVWPDRAKHMQWLLEQIARLQAPPGSAAVETSDRWVAKLWLWRNGDHFLAFDNEYPTYGPGGDPKTLGEPVGYALLDWDAYQRLIEQAEAEARAKAIEIIERRARGFASGGHCDAIFNGRLVAEELTSIARKIDALAKPSG